MTEPLNGEEWGVADAAALVAEIDRDLGERAATYGELVRKGRLDQREADFVAGLVGDIRDDLADAFAPLAAGECRPCCPRTARVTWRDKIRWIDRELADRKATYPELVRKGRLTEADARVRIGAIAHLRRLYWNRMFMWDPPEGPAREYLAALRSAALSGVAGAAARQPISNSEGGKLYRQFVRDHMAELDREADSGQGRMVA